MRKKRRTTKRQVKFGLKKATRQTHRAEIDQPDLIPDVRPENERAIAKVALEYRAAMKARLAALAIEKDRKEKLLALVKDAKLTPIEDGKIKFHVDGLLITITPRDELVRVKGESGSDAGQTRTGTPTTRRMTDKQLRSSDPTVNAIVEAVDDASAFPAPSLVPTGPDWRRRRITVLRLGKVLVTKLQARGIFFMGELADRAEVERLVETCGMTDVQSNQFVEACERFYADNKVGRDAEHER